MASALSASTSCNQPDLKVLFRIRSAASLLPSLLLARSFLG
jgi:hypothetical protein